MSIRIRDAENTCVGCQKIYVPLHDNYPCPSCKKINEVDGNFVEQLVWAMKYNKSEYGRFTPDGFYVSGLGANIQILVYRLFDEIEGKAGEYREGMFEEEIKNYFGKEREYLLPNVNDVVNSVYPRYLSENRFVTEKREFTLMDRLKLWWATLTV